MSLAEDMFDAVIVGGSYAGLSAALALGRARRNVLVIDAGEPCNAQTPHSHNFLTQDGTTPAAIASIAKAQVMKYPTITFHNDLVSSAARTADGFVLGTRSGRALQSRKLILATGIKDLMPDIAGFRECWGISVLHCPYCHGYEVKDARLGIIANGDQAMEFVKLIRQWSKDLVLLTNGNATLTPAQTGQLGELGVGIISEKVDAIRHQHGQLQDIQLDGGRRVSLDAVFTRIPFKHHTDLAHQLGCEFTEMNLIKVDELGKTSIDGVYAAGDCCVMFRTVSLAVSGGTKAGAGVNRELIEDDNR